MNAAPSCTLIDFRPLRAEDKALYERYLSDGAMRGCEASFANLFLWGERQIAFAHGHLLLLSRYGGRYAYPYPLGEGDKKPVIDAILADARARHIPCRFFSLTPEAEDTLRTLYPGQFRFEKPEDSFDYVYAIDDLADLPGKKYHGKRNHINRFRDAVPHCTAEPLCEENLPAARRMVDAWFALRRESDPSGEYQEEQAALEAAFQHFRELQMDALVLMNGEEAVALTMGSHLSEDTVDVHFEKARADIQGAYTAVNCAFARYIRDKYPAVRYLDREEDMGIEGLRKAKQSYYPHHMIEKCQAIWEGDL